MKRYRTSVCVCACRFLYIMWGKIRSDLQFKTFLCLFTSTSTFLRRGCFQDCPKTRLLESVDAYVARAFSVLALSSRGLDRCGLGLRFPEVILTRQHAPQSYAHLAGATEKWQGPLNLKIFNTHVVTMPQHLPEGTTAGMHITHQLFFSGDLTLELPGRWWNQGGCSDNDH